jgi:putative glycosyltransferase (TIGR04372 family)
MCISTSTGPDWISIAYGKPVLFLNALPLGGLFSFARSMWAPKNLVWKASGTELSLVEMLETTGFQTKDYESHGIVIQDLSPAEILLGVQEFCELMHDSQEIDYKNRNEQNAFWIHFSNWPRFSEFHRYMHAQSFVSIYWLKTRKRGFYD